MTPALKQVPVRRIPRRSERRHTGTVKRNGCRLGGSGGCGAMSLVSGTGPFERPASSRYG